MSAGAGRAAGGRRNVSVQSRGLVLTEMDEIRSVAKFGDVFVTVCLSFVASGRLRHEKMKDVVRVLLLKHLMLS